MNAEFYATDLVFVSPADIPGLLKFLQRAPYVPLKDVAYTCSKRLPPDGQYVSIVASGIDDLRSRLLTVQRRIMEGAQRVRDRSGTYYFAEPLIGPGREGRLAFVFPGGASFYPEMLRDVAIRFPACRATFDELAEALMAGGVFSPNDFIFPPAPYYRQDADVFAAGAYAEAMVSVYTANASLVRLLGEFGIKPDVVTGYAGGDMNALAAAGVFGAFPRPERLAFMRDMYLTVDNAAKHCGLSKCVMTALFTQRAEALDEIMSGVPEADASLALSQTPRQRTYAIRPEAAAALYAKFAESGVRPMKLSLDRPFNTVWAKGVLHGFNKFAGRWVKAKASIPIYSCRSGAPYPEKARRIRDESAMQLASPVLLDRTIERMYEDGVRVFLEVGPRGVTASSVAELLKGRMHASLSANAINRSGIVQLQHAVGMLAALGAKVDPSPLFENRGCRLLDFDNPLSLEIKSDAEMRLSRAFPKLVLYHDFEGDASPAPAGKVKTRLAAMQRDARRRKRLEFGGFAPLVSDADTIDEQPGVALEIAKTFTCQEAPFLADGALGADQISYADHSLRGLTMLTLTAGAEMMAELAKRLVPKRRVAALENLQSAKALVFGKGRLKLRLRAERVAAADPKYAAVKVQIREDVPDGAWTWPAMETTVLLAETDAQPDAFVAEPMDKPRNVHWTDRDIYPERLSSGSLLQWIREADVWSEAGLDYTVEVPPLDGALTYTRMPVWEINPQLMAAVTDGFALWRSHGRLGGAFSYAFRMRRLKLCTEVFPEGGEVKCYLRLSGVTPKSHIADIRVTDGNGNVLAELSGFEELVERVPETYRRLVLSPATAYLTEKLQSDLYGDPECAVASAMITDVPYPLFERHECLWLKTVSQIALGPAERRQFSELTGTVSRRTEWLFGRIAAKEAVRRYLSDFHQARWADADVQIWADDQGKPHPLGPWSDFISTKIDLAIAHTAQFVVAVTAGNARAGIDVEAVGRDLSEEFAHGVFTPEELELAALSVNAPNAMIRFWCAKEAVSKALGTGIRFPPKELQVASFKPETGEMGVVLTGQWLNAFKIFKGRVVHVTSKVVRGHILAACFLPENLFPPGGA